jgi:hypothetical protein
MLFTIIIIFYLVLFFWAILQYMSVYSPAILQEQLWGSIHQSAEFINSAAKHPEFMNSAIFMNMTLYS